MDRDGMGLFSRRLSISAHPLSERYHTRPQRVHTGS
jgi:hypothetical protein